MDSPEVVFNAVTPVRAIALKQFGLAGRSAGRANKTALRTGVCWKAQSVPEMSFTLDK